MIEQQAVVTAVRGTQAEVSVQRQTACGGCDQAGGCSTSVLAGLFNRRNEVILVDNSIGASPGDRVVLGIEESALQIASVVAYLLPILGLLLGAAFGSSLGAEPLSVAFGLLGLIVGLFWTRSLGRAASERARYRIRILKNQSRLPVSIDSTGLKI